MNKAFVKEDTGDDDDDLDAGAPPIPPGTKNYITPTGYRRLKDELLDLIKAKQKGRKPAKKAKPAASEGNVVSIMDALKRSLEPRK